MLASKSTKTTGTKPIKSIRNDLPREEAKTPEIETVSQSEAVMKANKSTPKKSVKKYVSKSSPSSNKKSSPLSLRASKVKQNLVKKEEVDAVILKPDGTSEQIKYNTSSKQANKLLNGRPTIIGELEQIQVIIVRCLNQTNCGGLNKNILPVPFCNKQYNGNYLLYRVDSKGNPINFTLKQYEQYVADNKTLTEQARKNYDPIDNQEIKAQSKFNSNSRLTLVYLRSECDKEIREEFKQKNGRNPTKAEIEDSVNIKLQKLVNELVSNSSPMNDPDYSPNDDAEENEIKINDEDEVIANLRKIYRDENGVDINNNDLIDTLCSTQRLLKKDGKKTQVIDDRDWRLQLNDALNYVRERGRLDGRILAEKISETFYELNGFEPSLDELIDVFRRIKYELTVESQQQMQYTADTNVEDNGSAYYLASKLGKNLSNADPSDLVDYAFRIVREDLVSRAKSSFIISKGRSPSKVELKQIVEKMALKLADKALETATKTTNRTSNDDPDYDPNNFIDKKLAYNDKLEDKEFDDNYFNLRMLTTSSTKSKTGIAEKYDVYFCKFDKKRKEKNLLKAIESFKMRNRREPNKIEIHRIKQFLSTTFDDTSLVQFKLSVISDSDNNEEEKDEILMMKQTKKSKLYSTTPSKVLVTPVKKKKTAARYNVYFEDDKLDETRNEKMAIKWFIRFNNRQPTKLELLGMQQFINADKSQLIECEYDVPISDDNSDDIKETEEDDVILKKIKTDFVVKKKSSTKYTLNFDDETERENGNKKQAFKWFKRFNNRNPTDEEQEKIKQFVKADNNEDTIDID